MLIDVLVDLSQNHAWNPVYIVSNYTKDRVKQHFPSAIYQDTIDARYGSPAPEFADMSTSAVMDQPTAEALGYTEVIALMQMDRMELLGGFSLRERLLLFRRLVAYWTTVFDRLRPDVLLSVTAPHVVYDYIAYALARQRGIPTVLFEYVGTDVGMLMAIDRFEDGLPPLMAEYGRLRADPPVHPVVLSGRMEAYWGRLRGSYEQAVPTWTRQFWLDSEKRRIADLEAAKQLVQAKQPKPPGFISDLRSTLAPLKTRPRHLLRALPSSVLGSIRRTLAPVDPAANLPPPPPPPPPAGGYYDGQFHVMAPEGIARAAADFRRERAETMKRRYEELAVEPDFERPFVYVALAMQPERTTNPNGGVFDDQDLMVGVIAAALPEGWRIYVKEHPSQFAYGTWIERGRWPGFYDAVVAYPQVSLVPLRTPAFELIDRAQAVATVAGTSSWEALVRGIPTLVFGEAWYKGCEGAYSVRTANDCADALERIKAGERPDPEAVRLFLHAADRTAFIGYLSDEDKPVARIDEAVNVKRLAHAILDCYEKSSARA